MDPQPLVSLSFEVPDDSPCTIDQPAFCEGSDGCVSLLTFTRPGTCVFDIRSKLENGDEPEGCYWNPAYYRDEAMTEASTGCGNEERCNAAREEALSKCKTAPL
jgi:hypothetical protein